MLKRLIAIALIGAILPVAAPAQDRMLTVAATTSVQDSGLFDFILPRFRERTSIPLRTLSRSSALALVTAERGNVDVVIVNDPGALDRFVERGYGTDRHKLMFDDFIIAGPRADPLGLSGMTDAPAALRKIARDRAAFLSRGDESGTNVAEQRLWAAAGVNPKARSGNWYRESGLGMGATLEMASRLGAYVMTDRPTWLALRDRITLDALVEGDPRLFNQYEVILTNPDKHPSANHAHGLVFLRWLVSDEGQQAIAAYRINGTQAFYPNAPPMN